MADRSDLSRGEFLRLVGLGLGVFSSGTLLAACSAAPSPGLPPAASPSVAATPLPVVQVPEVEIALRATQADYQILPGKPTHVWQYQGQVLSGPAEALQALPDSYLGPVLRLQRGQKLRVHFTNDLPDPTIIHWHGLHVPEAMDGQPMQVIQRGQTYEYEYEILNRAGTYWYHPHPHGLTGPQVCAGLAGLLIVSDPEEAALGLPGGEYDLPLVIQDRQFDADNQIFYGGDQMIGYLGDRVLVNGQVDAKLELAADVYRLRILNGSNARTYLLAWDDGAPLTVIGTDGGLLAKPVQRQALTLAPGERVELWADFSQYAPETELLLKSLPFSAGGESMGMMGGGSGAPYGAALDVLRVRIARPGAKAGQLPERLTEPGFHRAEDAQGKPRPFVLAMQHMTGTINGRTYEMDAVAPDEVVKLDSLEIWEFENAGGMGMGMMGAMMAQPHPMHLHAVQFQVIERLLGSGNDQTLRAGLVDDGWKDTLLVLPGERARVLVKFENFAGRYLYHCHNLEHEDGGMMRNFRIDA